MHLYEATRAIVERKDIMLHHINQAIRDFEQQTALVVTGLHVNMARRKTQLNFAEKYPPALEKEDIEIQLIEP